MVNLLITYTNFTRNFTLHIETAYRHGIPVESEKVENEMTELRIVGLEVHQTTMVRR